MKVMPTELDGVVVVEPRIFEDERGYFFESYSRQRYVENGIDIDFVQDNQSFSTKGILRGLHYQVNRVQAKLVRVIEGEIFDVAVDVRRNSPNFGKWVGRRLSGENQWQMFVPGGFAHGFCVLSETALVNYKCSNYYSPQDERGLMWNDPDIGIEWPLENPSLSDKDLVYPRFSELNEFPEMATK